MTRNEAAERARLVRLFCTPPSSPTSPAEVKALEESERFAVPFAAGSLDCFSWGAGDTILLCHGWGSRASHMALAGRVLARAGFRAVAFDAPGHRSLPGVTLKETSSMFEFARAAAAVARFVGGVRGLVGHSLGAMAPLFALAGAERLEELAFPSGRLALLSAPATLACVVGNFCRRHGLAESQRGLLEKGLETEFSMSIDRYDCARALRHVDADVLLIQDEDDDQFPPGETLARTADASRARVFTTRGLGHDRIIASRRVFAELVAFLKQRPADGRGL